jgi:hypothetical protein
MIIKAISDGVTVGQNSNEGKKMDEVHIESHASTTAGLFYE